MKVVIAIFTCKERSMEPSILFLWQLDEKEHFSDIITFKKPEDNRRVK